MVNGNHIRLESLTKTSVNLASTGAAATACLARN